jgi:two-component system nitrogen regulation response regulator GlnG/two-component system response regulator HydG
MKDGPETIETESDRPVLGKDRGDEPALGFVVLWSRDDPARLGAWAAVPNSGGPRLLGRGEALASDPCPRLTWVRQRPGSNEPVAPFEARSLSRGQLVVRAVSSDALEVENTGRAALLVNGELASAKAQVRPGDVLEIGRQLCVLCVQRPRKIKGPAPSRSHRFGESDAHGFVGEAPAAWQLRDEIEHAARSRAHVLILGASGTGKEIVARAIHALSKPGGPLVARNATTLPESLVDAELFGNAKNYPNAGMPERSGLVGAADGGTLFLDEFGELALGVQAHLLRVLDSGEYQRLGESAPRVARFRLIAATNRPEAALREDVRARFGHCLRIPELSRRAEDLPLVARHLFKAMVAEDVSRFQGMIGEGGEPRFGVAWIRQLVQSPLPGNVRGLRQLLLQVMPDDLEPPLPGGVAAAPSRAGADQSDGRTLPPPGSPDASELQAALDRHNGSIEKTWRALGLSSRHALMRLIRKYNVTVRKQPR